MQRGAWAFGRVSALGRFYRPSRYTPWHIPLHACTNWASEVLAFHANAVLGLNQVRGGRARGFGLRNGHASPCGRRAAPPGGGGGAIEGCGTGAVRTGPPPVRSPHRTCVSGPAGADAATSGCAVVQCHVGPALQSPRLQAAGLCAFGGCGLGVVRGPGRTAVPHIAAPASSIGAQPSVGQPPCTMLPRSWRP